MIQLALFAALSVSIILYIINVVKLLDEIEYSHPDIWKNKLKSPRRIVLHSYNSPNFHTISPIFPFLKWLATGKTHELVPDAKRLFIKSRLFFVLSISFLLIHIIVCC